MKIVTVYSQINELQNRILSCLLVIIVLFFISTSASLAQTGPPNIKYTTPNVYLVNSPITPLAPNNTGGPVAAVVRGTFSNVAGAADGTGGLVDGKGTDARFFFPGGLAVDANGNLFVADREKNAIRKVTPDGTVSTLATEANGIDQPWGIEVHPVTGDIYVCSNKNHRIIKITQSGIVTIYAGNAGVGFTDGPLATAKFDSPQDLIFDAAGNLYVSDSGNKLIRKITPLGIVSTVAGNRTAGNTDGLGVLASFNTANGLTIDRDGNLVISDFISHLIRKMTPAGMVTTYAGTTASGFKDGSVTAPIALDRPIFSNPSHMITDYQGNIYLSDSRNDRIRMITPAGVVSTVVGSSVFGSNKGDDIGNGNPALAKLENPVGVAYDKFANLYIADEHNNKIKKLALGGYVLTPGFPLPTGLTFDPTTGIISGTPTQLWQETRYKVTGYNGFGESSSEFTIRVIPTAVYLIPFSPVTICDPDLDPAGLSNLPLTYTSSNPNVARITSNGMIEMVGIGTTTITATNTAGDKDSQDLVVSDYALPVVTVTADKTILCPEANAILTAATSMAGKNPAFEWFKNGVSIGNNSKTYTAVNPSLNDKFTVKVTNTDYCYPVISKESDPVVLNPVPLPPTTSISLSPAAPACMGTVLKFTAVTSKPQMDTGPFPKWYVNGKEMPGINSTLSSDQLKEGDVVKYVVPFNNPCGPVQSVTSNEIVVAYKKAELCNIMPPTAFSPNGDGINDTWNIEYLVGFPNCQVRIFSRFGQKLYDSTGYATPWDGKSNGVSLPSGTYYYVIALEKDMETVSGSITIIK